jgi:nucleotide-binding universal stress UspA family protein
MLLGSISQHCFQHAKCPVVVMRGEPAAVKAA